MPHDETMTRDDWLKRARIAGREARERHGGTPEMGAMLDALVAWRIRHPDANAIIGAGYAFRAGWCEPTRYNTPR